MGKVALQSHCAWRVSKIQMQSECTRKNPCLDRAPTNNSRMVLVLTAIMQRRMEKWRTCSTVCFFFQLELELILGAGFPSSHLSHLHTAEVVVQWKLHRQEYTAGDILFMAADFAGVPHRITEIGFNPLCWSPTEGSVMGQQGQAARSSLPLLGKLWPSRQEGWGVWSQDSAQGAGRDLHCLLQDEFPPGCVLRWDQQQWLIADKVQPTQKVLYPRE